MKSCTSKVWITLFVSSSVSVSNAFQPSLRTPSILRNPVRKLVSRRGAEGSSSSNNKPASIRHGVSSIVAKIRRKPTDIREQVEQLEKENARLRSTIERLETDNERLEYEAYNRIVLEQFEGEGRNRRNYDSITAPDEFMTLTGEEMLSGDDTSMWCDELEDGTCPVEPTISFGEALRDRAYWLVGLLALQSCSGFILARNEALLADHPVIVYFLTMLVGAGGNAGNQASVRVIRGLALGTLNEQTQAQFLTRELKMAFALSIILSVAGFIRAAVFRTPVAETVAITSALALIVFSSILLGAVLPLLLKRIGVDPAHSSTSIQVVMDILGVVLAVVVSRLLLDSPWGVMIVSKLVGT